MPDFTFPDAIGSIGAGLIVLAYVLLQIERLRSDHLAYSVLNGVGAALILFSLYFAFNLSAFLIESFWILISLFGIWKAFRRRSNPGEPS